MNFLWFYIVAGNIVTALYLGTLYIMDEKFYEDKIYPYLQKVGPVYTVLTLMLIVPIWPAAFIELLYNLLGLLLRIISKK